MSDQTSDNPDSASRVEAVIDDVIRRRVNGERLGDAQVISGHPELMPELADWLAKLRLLALEIKAHCRQVEALWGALGTAAGLSQWPESAGQSVVHKM